MEKRLRATLGLGAVVLTCLALASPAAAAPSGDTPEPPKPCCFTNERYAGVCRVVPAEGETCDGIEAYLNNPSSTGRTYCASTNIREGWIQVNCKTGKPKEDPPATPSSTRKTTHPRHTHAAPR